MLFDVNASRIGVSCLAIGGANCRTVPLAKFKDFVNRSFLVPQHRSDGFGFVGYSDSVPRKKGVSLV